MTGNTICPAFPVPQTGLAYDVTTDTYYSGSFFDNSVQHFNADGEILDSASVGLAITGLAYNAGTGHLFAFQQTGAGAGSDDVYILDPANGYAVLGSFLVGAPRDQPGRIGRHGDGLRRAPGPGGSAGRQSHLRRRLGRDERLLPLRGQIPWSRKIRRTARCRAGGLRCRGNTASIALHFDATGLLPGLRQAQFTFSTDTPNKVPAMPVTLTVSFLDVPDDNQFQSFIYGAAGAGVMLGGPPNCPAGVLYFCPAGIVTRADMAGYIFRGVHGASTPPPVYQNIFQDVTFNQYNSFYIQGVYDDGIAAGCSASPALYCPNIPVTRAQMSALIWKGMFGTRPAGVHRRLRRRPLPVALRGLHRRALHPGDYCGMRQQQLLSAQPDHQRADGDLPREVVQPAVSAVGILRIGFVPRARARAAPVSFWPLDYPCLVPNRASLSSPASFWRPLRARRIRRLRSSFSRSTRPAPTTSAARSRESPLTPSLDAPCAGRHALLERARPRTPDPTRPLQPDDGPEPARARRAGQWHFLLPADLPTLAAVLSGRGYTTAAFVSSRVLDRRFGLDRGFAVYDDAMVAERTGEQGYPERGAGPSRTRRWRGPSPRRAAARTSCGSTTTTRTRRTIRRETGSAPRGTSGMPGKSPTWIARSAGSSPTCRPRRAGASSWRSETTARCSASTARKSTASSSTGRRCRFPSFFPDPASPLAAPSARGSARARCRAPCSVSSAVGRGSDPSVRRFPGFRRGPARLRRRRSTASPCCLPPLTAGARSRRRPTSGTGSSRRRDRSSTTSKRTRGNPQSLCLAP